MRTIPPVALGVVLLAGAFNVLIKSVDAQDRSTISVPNNGRELLHVYGIDSSQLNRFHDGKALGLDDEETLIRILYHFPRFSPEKLERWSKRDSIELAALAAAPAEHRGTVVRITGRAKRVVKAELLPELARRLDFGHYYQVTIQTSDNSGTAFIATRVIPETWPIGEELDEPIAALAMFLKTGERLEQGPSLVFAAGRLAWHPDQANAALGASQDHVLLAQLGVDIGLLQQQRESNRKPFVAADREIFYQLLAALRRSTPGQFATRVRKAIDLPALLQQPEQHHGDLMLVSGQARRVTKVRVDEPDIQERFGLDHYFQLDVFMPLDRQIVRIGPKEKGRDAPTFRDTYPVTICVPALPPGLKEGEDTPVDVRVPAAFFKLWAYRSEFIASFDEKQLQLSPMFIGTEPQVIVPEAVYPRLGVALAIIFVVTLLGFWWGLLRQGRKRSVISRVRPQ